MLTQKEVKRLFHYNYRTGVLTRKVATNKNNKVGSVVGSPSHGYLQVWVSGENYRVHRLVWLWWYGYFPEGGVDHRDKNKTNNRLRNLREISQQCNIRNTGNPRDNTSGVKGVSWDKWANKWRITVCITNSRKHVGRCEDFDEAVLLRLATEQCLDWNKCDSSSPAYQYAKKHNLIAF